MLCPLKGGGSDCWIERATWIGACDSGGARYDFLEWGNGWELCNDLGMPVEWATWSRTHSESYKIKAAWRSSLEWCMVTLLITGTDLPCDFLNKTLGVVSTTPIRYGGGSGLNFGMCLSVLPIGLGTSAVLLMKDLWIGGMKLARESRSGG